MISCTSIYTYVYIHVYTYVLYMFPPFPAFMLPPPRPHVRAALPAKSLTVRLGRLSPQALAVRVVPQVQLCVSHAPRLLCQKHLCTPWHHSRQRRSWSFRMGVCASGAKMNCWSEYGVVRDSVDVFPWCYSSHIKKVDFGRCSTLLQLLLLHIQSIPW